MEVFVATLSCLTRRHEEALSSIFAKNYVVLFPLLYLLYLLNLDIIWSKVEIGNRVLYVPHYFHHGNVPGYRCDAHHPRSPASSGQLAVYELNLLHGFLPLRFVSNSPFLAQAYGSVSQALLVVPSDSRTAALIEAVFFFSQSGSMPTNRNRSSGYRILARCSCRNLSRLKSCEITVTSRG